MITKALILSLTVAACLAVPSNIIRPCKLNHYNCIGKNLASNSRCNLNVRGIVPKEYQIKSFRYNTPYFNATYIDNDLIIRNHNKCVVSEFFFNVQSNTAVLSLDCPNLEFQSTRTLLQHYSRSEDLTYSFNYFGIYPLIRLTVNLPHANTMDLCTSYTFADVTALPIFKVNPNDVNTANFLSTDLSFLNIFERENMQARADELLRYFVESLICNFGCKK